MSMKNRLSEKLNRRLLAVILALVQCLSLSGCIIGEGRVDLPMAPTVEVPLVNTSKTVRADDIKKFQIPGKNAFYLLPGVETDPELMVDFKCFDYTTEGEFVYMYSAPGYIDPAEISAYRGTRGIAPEEGSGLPIRDNGATCDALIVMTYNPYTRAYHVLDAQVYFRTEKENTLSETEYFPGDGFYMLANAYGGKLGEQERYFVMDRAGTARVYSASGEILFESALSALLKSEVDKLIEYYYLDENGNRKPKKKDTDDDSSDDDDKKEAMEEVENETGNESEKESPTEHFSISPRAKKAGVSVLLKGAVMDSNNMTYLSVMMYDMGSPFDPDSEIHEEIVTCLAVEMDSADVKYLSYNRNWPKQQAEWMKLDDKTIRLRINEDENTLASALNTIQKAGLGKGVTMGELLGNDLKTLQKILGMDSIKTGSSYLGNTRTYQGGNIFNVNGFNANRLLAKEFLGIDLADVPDDYSPFLMGQESGFPSFIAGWADIGNSLDRINTIADRRDTGYELSMDEQILNAWMDENQQHMWENNKWIRRMGLARSADTYEDFESMKNGLGGYWTMIDYLSDSSKMDDLSYYKKKLYEDIGKMTLSSGQSVSRSATLKQDLTAKSAFRSLWNARNVSIKNELYKMKTLWFIKLGYKKVGDKTIRLTNGFTNNWKRSYYAGAYQFFKETVGMGPIGMDYSTYEKPNTGTGYDQLADGRLYYQMSILENSAVNLTPRPGAWIAGLQSNQTPFYSDGIEMLFAYHESPFKGSIKQTSAMIYEVPPRAEGLKTGNYGASHMEACDWNEEMTRTIHVDFSEDLSESKPVGKNLPQAEIRWIDEKSFRWEVEPLTSSNLDSHWRDALTVYVRDRLAYRDQKFYEDLTGYMQESQLAHAAALQAALNDVYKDNVTRWQVNMGLGVKKWVTQSTPTPFKKHFEEIYEALRQVSTNLRNLQSAREAIIKGGLATTYSRMSYQNQLQHCYDPIRNLSLSATQGYLDFRNACIAHGVGDFLTVVRPEGMTEDKELYAEIRVPQGHFDEASQSWVDEVYKFYYDEDAWWDVDDNWASFVQNRLINSGRYSDSEIAAILDVHKGLIHVRETIPAHTIPTTYRMVFPEGSTAYYATSSEQAGNATAAPQEGVILYYETSSTNSNNETKQYSNIDYFYPRSIQANSIVGLPNLTLTTAMISQASGLMDRFVAGAPLDAGYINYRDGNGEITQMILLVTDQGVKFYHGEKHAAGKGQYYFTYQNSQAQYVPNEEFLPSSGYTASVEEQTAETMEQMKQEEDPAVDDTSVLDAYGNFVQKTRDAVEKAKEAAKNGDKKDQRAGEKQREKAYIQGVLNASRVGSVSSVSCFTMTGKDELLISSSDAGLTLYNVTNRAVVPLANGAYFRSFRVKTKVNDNAETDAVLEEQTKTAEQSYKVLGFNTDEYEYKPIDLARAKVYDLDLAKGKEIAYQQAVRREVTQRAIDYIRMPLRTRVNEKGVIVSIPMTEEEKKAYESYHRLFNPNALLKDWKAELHQIARDIGLLGENSELVAYTKTLRERVKLQKQEITAIYTLLGARLDVRAKDPAYWNNVALRLSTVVETDALEEILVEIRMHKDVVKNLDSETQSRYEEYRKIFDISSEQGAVVLEKREKTIEKNQDNLLENPETTGDKIMEGIEQTGDAHAYMTEQLGSDGESERNLRGEYYNDVLDDIKVLMVVAHGLRTKEEIASLDQKDVQETMNNAGIDSDAGSSEEGTGDDSAEGAGEKKDDLTRTIVFTEAEQKDYQETIEKWLKELNPDNFREQTDQVLLEFVNMINMVGEKIAATDIKKQEERLARVRERMSEVDSVTEIEAVIISEQVLTNKYAAYLESFEKWDERPYERRSDRVAKLKTNQWYEEIISEYKENEEVVAFLKQQDMTWEEYLKKVILRCGKGVVYDDSGKVEGATVDVDEATNYYNENGTMEGYAVTADIDPNAPDESTTTETSTTTQSSTTSRSQAASQNEAPSGYPGVGR